MVCKADKSDIKQKEVYWECPFCGRRMIDTQMQSLRCDVGCPRGCTSLAYFKGVEK